LVVSYRFLDIDAKIRPTGPPLFDAPGSGRTPQNFWIKLIPQKLSGLGHWATLWCESCMILTSTVSD